MLEKGATILLRAHSQYRGVYLGVVQRLKEELDAEIHLYVSTRQDVAFYDKTYPGLFASIRQANVLHKTCSEPVEQTGRVIAEARHNEADLGVTVNELAVGDRNLGRGFSPGGFNYPRSRISEETSYFQMVNAFNAAIDYWKKEIKEKRPDLILNSDQVMSAMAKRYRILVRNLANSRYENFYYWAINEFLEAPEIETGFGVANNEELVKFEKPNADHLKLRSRFYKRRSYLQLLRNILLLSLRYIYWNLRRYEKAKRYHWRENVSYVWRNCRAIRRMTSNNLLRLSDLKEDQYIFFPLATEPEVALQWLSPEYMFQLEAIISIARDAPAGVTVLVKEHFAACGARPPSFYDQIAELKNVRFANMAEYGLDIVHSASVVATISGTAGLEGAVLGKPVIAFGRHNIYNFLPHVMVVTDQVQLKDYLEYSLSSAFNAAAARRDGQRFMKALLDISFDLKSFSAIEPDKVEDSTITSAYRALRRSFREADRAMAPVT